MRPTLKDFKVGDSVYIESTDELLTGYSTTFGKVEFKREKEGEKYYRVFCEDCETAWFHESQLTFFPTCEADLPRCFPELFYVKLKVTRLGITTIQPFWFKDWLTMFVAIQYWNRFYNERYEFTTERVSQHIFVEGCYTFLTFNVVDRLNAQDIYIANEQRAYADYYRKLLLKKES